MMHSRINNFLTIDVEEWFQTVMFDNTGIKAAAGSDLEKNISDIIALLDKYGTKATFFVVGSVAERHPSAVSQILKNGHEIASHGYAHRLVYKMTPQEFEKDLDLSLGILKEVTGEEVLGYRACTWSITRDTPWALDTLKERGLRYDSSIYPVNFYPFGRVKRFPYKIKDGLFEIPPSVFEAFGCHLPFGGGTFLRFLPLNFIKEKITRLNREGFPAVVYFHSWEAVDETPPDIRMSAWKRFIQYKNVGQVLERVELLLKEFSFVPMRAFLNGQRF